MKKISDFLEKGINWILFLLLSAMVCFIFTQVFSRFVLNRPLSWTEELSRHLMIWMAFLAASVGYRRGVHLSINLVEERLKGWSKRIYQLLLTIPAVVFLGYMTFYGFKLVEKTSVQVASALQYKMSYVYLSIPVSALLMLFFSAEKFLQIISSKRSE
ncbi:MAG: TRAP transporter small permease [Thermotogae bacterium]|nr:TRAP transporter small permease [Thermotogota bacterium]